MKRSMIAVTLAVALAFVFTSCSSLEHADDIRTITVSGQGTVSVKPDMATFGVTVTETKETTSLAQSAVNEKISQVLGMLTAAGIADEDISTNNLSMYPEYQWIDGKRNLLGQSCSQSLNVKVKNLDSLGSLIDQLGKVDGISLGSVSFDKQDKSEAYRDARMAAAKAAEEKASTYAESFSMVLGKPLSVTEGTAASYPVARKFAVAAVAMDNAVESTEVPNGLMQITTNVSVVYQVQ